MSDEMYGVVSSPTIRDIYTDIYAYCDTHNLSPRDCLLWKDDISGAFPQFHWTSSFALLMALMIDEEYVLISINGDFGYLSSPSIWEIIANAVLWMCLVVALFIRRGLLWKYVDDFMGFAPAAVAAQDQQRFRGIARGIVSPTAINESKCVAPSVSADLLGWDNRLDVEMSGPNQKGCDKLLHCFFRIDVQQKHSKG
jgi:hypothetical protein